MLSGTTSRGHLLKGRVVLVLIKCQTRPCLNLIIKLVFPDGMISGEATYGLGDESLGRQVAES